MVQEDFCVLVALSHIVGIGRHRRRSMGVVIPLFHHSIPLFHSTIPFHRSIPPNKDTHAYTRVTSKFKFANVMAGLQTYLDPMKLTIKGMVSR